MCDEQFRQITFPQARQWCRRKVILNLVAQIRHFVEQLSGIQMGAWIDFLLKLRFLYWNNIYWLYFHYLTLWPKRVDLFLVASSLLLIASSMALVHSSRIGVEAAENEKLLSAIFKVKSRFKPESRVKYSIFILLRGNMKRSFKRWEKNGESKRLAQIKLSLI